jgi:hypothetical protein
MSTSSAPTRSPNFKRSGAAMTSYVPGPRRTRRVEFEYVSGGTLAFLAQLDVHHATRDQSVFTHRGSSRSAGSWRR